MNYSIPPQTSAKRTQGGLGAGPQKYYPKQTNTYNLVIMSSVLYGCLDGDGGFIMPRAFLRASDEMRWKV